jgi:hypothetical protein
MNTKKLKSSVFFTFLFLFFSALLFAKEVNPSTVSLVALNAFAQCSGKLKNDLSITNTITIKEKGQAVFSIFNFKEGGYIIVANDDAVTPILGYGFNYNFYWDKIPKGLKYLLNEYKNEILSIKKESTVSMQIRDEWEKYFSSDESPLLIKSYTVGTKLLLTL